MTADHGDGTSARNARVDPDDDSALEPEIVRWLWEYADATDGAADATVGAILGEVNWLLRQHRAEDSVHRADYGSRLRVLTEHMPVILWTTDTELQVTSFAGGGLAHVEVQPSSGVSLPLADLLGTGSPNSRALAAHASALRGQPDVYEYAWRSRSYLAHVEPLNGPDGIVVGTIGLAIDVTERKQVEAALARRERQLAEAQQLAQLGSWELDVASRRFTWSEKHYLIFGLSPEVGPLTPEITLKHLHPDDVERIREVWGTTLRTGEPYACDLRIVRPDGEIRVIHSRGTLIQDASGQPERMVGTCQDITERVQANEAIRTSQQMFAHLLECFPNGSVNVFDPDLRYVMTAGRGLAQIGLTPEQVIGKTLAELFPPEQVAVVEGPYRRAFTGETVTVDLPHAGRTYALSAAPLDRVDGVVRSIIVVAQDVTERVQAEQERAEQRERQARLDGMLFAARQLAARVTSSLATSSGAIDRLQPDPALAPHLRDAIGAATVGLAEATRAIAELERLIHSTTSEQPARPVSNDQPSTLNA